MLELRPNCECCDKDLPPAATDAMICTFECTFCRACAESRLGGVCPNCGGNLVARPLRPTAISRLVSAASIRASASGPPSRANSRCSRRNTRKVSPTAFEAPLISMRCW